MTKFVDIMYSNVTVVKSTAFYAGNLLRVDLKCSHHTKKDNYMS